MELRERLSVALSDAGASQADLARACKIKAPSVSDWLSGKTKLLKGPNLIRAANFLNVNSEWLGAGKGPMRGDSPKGRLDAELVRDVAQALQDVFREQGKVFHLEEAPDLFIRLYEGRVATGETLTVQDAVAVGRWLERGGSDVGAEAMPAQGGTEKDAGAKATNATSPPSRKHS